MGRFIVLVIDSFGIGYMDDVLETRPQDFGANTCKNILKNKPFLNLQNFENLGLVNALGERVNIMDFSPKANYGIINLAHEGGDTFMGHQEIMGTKPKKPLVVPINLVLEKIKVFLENLRYKTRYYGNKNKILIVNEAVTIGDNFEADLGQVYNVSADLNKISFEEVTKLGIFVREITEVARIIAFGGLETNLDKMLMAYQEKDCYAGIHTPNSGIYKKGFKVVHLGYGINHKEQIPYILKKNSIKTLLFGKVADIVWNLEGINYTKLVKTEEIFEYALEEIQINKEGFFCINIQETDLAGHSQDLHRYAERLSVCDEYIGKIIESLNSDDILVVTADHGNDPTIGHNKHTREKVPLLLYKKDIAGIKFGTRNTLADIGASVIDYFNLQYNGFGESFLKNIKIKNV